MNITCKLELTGKDIRQTRGSSNNFYDKKGSISWLCPTCGELMRIECKMEMLSSRHLADNGHTMWLELYPSNLISLNCEDCQNEEIRKQKLLLKKFESITPEVKNAII